MDLGQTEPSEHDGAVKNAINIVKKRILKYII